ncbi:MAG: hypothetical protein K4H23_03455 [Mollicutes bacterium PWAP]|nr:hypothetical protein [Mollicutes bacterium PWAP]
MIYKYSNNNPRNIKIIIRRLNDFKLVKKIKLLNSQNILLFFKTINIYEYGLRQIHIDILKLIYKQKGKRISLNKLANLLNLKSNEIEMSLEVPLISAGLLNVSSIGRSLSIKGNFLLKNIKI